MLIRFVRFGKKVRGILNRGAFRQVEGHSMPVAQAEGDMSVLEQCKVNLYSVRGFATVEAERKASVGSYAWAHITYRPSQMHHTILAMTLFSGSSFHLLFLNTPSVPNHALFAPPV